MDQNTLEKFNRKDIRLIIIAVLVAAISVVIAWFYFDDAFPEANIHFDVDRSASEVVALHFLQSQGFSITPYRHASIFDYDNQAKIYLERELGLKKANELMSGPIKIWHWSHRWFRSKQTEEYDVNVTPQGAITKYQRILPEDAEGENLTQAEAEVLARDFLTNNMSRSLDHYTLIEHSSDKLDNRTDHTFTWERTDLLPTDATYRYEVTVQGDEFGGFREYLKIPETFTRDYQKMRSANNTTSLVDSFFLLLTLVAMLFILIQKSRLGDIKWKTAAIVGAIGAILTLGSQFNSLPLSLYNYSTTDAYGDFVTQQILMGILNALLTGIGLFALTAAAEPLYRERYGEKLSLSRAFTFRGIRTKRFFIAVLIGLVLTCFFMAYQTIFYLVSSKFGAWAPADVPYSDLLNTWVPWIFVLLMGFFPAVSEEFMSRMFSIPFLQKYLKVGWLAIVIPALIWGFGHAAYPNQPFYIRGVEVGMAGIVIGIIMLKFGIVATLIWHYTVDALYTAFLLFRSGNSYYIVSGAVTAGIMLIPLLIAGFLYFKNGGFRPAADLTNQAEGVAPPKPKIKPEPVQLLYKSLPLKKVLIGGMAAVLLGCAIFLPSKNPSGFINVKITRKDVKQQSRAWLASQTDSSQAYKSAVTMFNTGRSQAMKYLLENTTIDSTRMILQQFLYPRVWRVRFFRPLDKEEYRIQYNPDTGDMVAFQHILPENTPGDSLDTHAATALAVRWLAAHDVDTTNYTLKSIDQEARPHRLDYKITFEGTKTFWASIAQGRPQIVMEAHGDAIGLFVREYHLPEDWTRTRTAQTLGRTVHNVGRLIVLFLFAISGIVLLIRKLRQVDAFSWRTPIIIGAAVFVISALLYLNQANSIASNYMTTMPWNQFQIIIIISLVIGALGMGGIILLETSLNNLYFPGSLLAWKAPERYVFARDALVIVPITILGLLGIEYLQAWIRLQFPSIALFPIDSPTSAIDTAIPILGILGSAFIRGILYAGGLGLFVILWKDYFRPWVLKVMALILVLLTLVPPSTLTGTEWVLQAGLALLPMIWLAVIWIFFLRNNYLAYIMIPIGVIGLSQGLNLYSQDGQPYIIQGILVFVVFAVLWFWTLADGLRHRDVTLAASGDESTEESRDKESGDSDKQH